MSISKNNGTADCGKRRKSCVRKTAGECTGVNIIIFGINVILNDSGNGGGKNLEQTRFDQQVLEIFRLDKIKAEYDL